LFRSMCLCGVRFMVHCRSRDELRRGTGAICAGSAASLARVALRVVLGTVPPDRPRRSRSSA
jgi:hypothetical protein